MADLQNPISRYLGDYITCFPSSNATDDGKLQLEFNQARYVTRLSSKNFCIVKPSFVPTIYVDTETGLPQIKFSSGQASINGMDLIMTSEIYIDPPVEPGHYYLAFKLARDSSENVLGDLIYGATTTFEGVYLTYYKEKPEPQTDMDMLYLCEFDWDGNEFTNLTEDEDKYGRIWAEDILCKFLDPKHPDVRRLNLQEYIYKLPDWYFSKEGDTVYGPITIAKDRTDTNSGILINVDETGSHITMKDPKDDNNLLQFYGDLNRDGVIDEKDIEIIKNIISGKILPTDLQKHLGDVNHDGVIDEKDLKYIENFINKNKGNYGDTGNIYFIDNSSNQINFITRDGKHIIELGGASITESKEDDILHIHNEGDICMDSEGKFTVEADSEISMSTKNENSPKLKLDDSNVNISSPLSPDLEFNYTFLNENEVQQTIGKAIWQYNKTNKKISLLESNVSYLDVKPNADFEKSIRTQDTLYIGNDSIYGNEKTYLKKLNWRITNANNTDYIDITPKTVNILSSNATGTSYILLRDTGSTKYSRINDNGTVELQNNAKNSSIIFKDGTPANTVTVEKILGKKQLNIDGDITCTGNIIANKEINAKGGLKTSNGILTFVKGSNNATISKDNNSTILRTSSHLYVGSSGQSELHSGNTVINGTLGVGGDTYQNSELKVDASGNLNTSGTITGSKVFNAVYNDAVEFMEKEDYNELIEPGDVVYFTNNGKVTKWNPDVRIECLAGVVSSEETYGYALGGEGLTENQKVPIALIGRVFLKVNINVKSGDLLGVNELGQIVIVNDINRYTLGKATTQTINDRVYIKVI